MAVYALIGMNAFVFFLQATLPPRSLEAFVMAFGIVPSAWSGPGAMDVPPAWQLLTTQFLHGSLLHVLGNMWMLWIFGDNVEDCMGSIRFVAFYVLCGVLAGAAHLVTNLGSDVPAIGASGAVAGVMGAYLLLYPRASVILLVPVFFYPMFFEVRAVLFLGLWFVMQSFSGLADTLAGPAAAGVAYWAHVGGFLAGMALFSPFLKRRGERRRLYPDEWGAEAAWRRGR